LTARASAKTMMRRRANRGFIAVTPGRETAFNAPELLRGRTIQIVNYHETTPSACPDGLHTISDATFDTHLRIIEDSGVNVTRFPPARGTLAPASGIELLITFDDGKSSDLRNAAKLARRGWQGAFFISTAMIGQPGYLNKSQVRELHAMGMTLGSHGHDHIRLSTLPHDQARQQLRRSKAELEQLLGVTVDSMAFPGGDLTQALSVETIRQGYKNQFGTAWGANRLNGKMPMVWKRNNVINTMDAEAFHELITLKCELRRRLMYWGRTVLHKHLPAQTYGQLRGWLSAL
jgi:peptidoglycan/xylan/chitin deacetylase (PgdA/CDA1 family)